MSDTITITVNLEDAINGVLHVEIACDMAHERTDFTLEALTVGNAIAVTDLAVRDPADTPVPFDIYQATVTVHARVFTLCYTLRTPLTVCIGVDNARELMYPFATPWEVFFGSGSLAYPADWRSLDGTAAFKIANLPQDFGVFTSLTQPDAVLPAQLPSFFVYASLEPAIRSHRTTFKNGHAVTFNLLVQDGKTIPISVDEVFAFIDDFLAYLETRLAPPTKASTINILILQAADDFQEIAYGQTFATGENVIGGITCYAPTNADYLHEVFGTRDYADYLRDGLAHELAHLMTSAGSDAQHKAILYPAHDCRGAARRLIGESLAGYTHTLYMYRADRDGFVTRKIAHWLRRQQAHGRRSPLLDLFLFDVWLRAQGGKTLLDVFGAMIRRQQTTDEPFQSAAILFDAAEAETGIAVPPALQEQMIGDTVPDYPALLGAALARIGYALDGDAITNQSESNELTFEV